jgi:hypothetical protein
MIGLPVVASGISYHETHTLTADGHVSARFGRPLEIPEDLVPIPTDRPTALDANHPLGRFVTVLEPEDAPSINSKPVDGSIRFVDAEAGVVLRFHPIIETPNAFGVYPYEVLTDRIVKIEYDEEAIQAENDRRLKKALECAAMYAGVIELHEQRCAAEKAARENAARAEGADERTGIEQENTTDE